MRTILSLLLVFFLHSAKAATYYFSTSSGNDSRTATQATNPSTPWKTINKLNSFFSSLKPGDAVLFKRGETFYGSITINKSGTSGSPIYIGAYGTGDKPVITSLVTLSGWKANSAFKGVYDCNANSALGDQVNIVLLNDVQKAIGRYPNIDAPNKGYLTIESHKGTKSITDKQLSSRPNWTGAEVAVRSSHWIINRALIKSHSGNTINFSASVFTRDNYGYFIQNSIKTLDKLGEWYYNPSTKKLSMYFGSNSPSSYTVKASAINSLIYSNRVRYVVFDNLTIKGADKYGFDINNGSNIQIKNCNVLFSGIDGVRISYNPYSLVENCNVFNSNNNGIAAADGSSTNTIIRNNIVKDTYIIPGMGQSGDGQGAGISINKNGLAEYNQVINSGYVGIQIQGNDVTVKNNYIDNFCFIKDDGAGVYTHNGAKLTNKGRKIIGNIILNGIGAGPGTNTLNSSAQGIYMDDNVNGIEITGNTIANCNRGVYLHNSRDIIVRNNTLYNNYSGQIYITKDGYGGILKNNTVIENILFAKGVKQKVLAVNTIRDDKDIRNIGRLDNNYYARPMNNSKLIFTTTYLYTSKQKKTERELADWKSIYKKDMLSKVCSKTFTGNPDANIKFLYNASQVKKSIALGGNYVDAKNNKYQNNILLQPYTSAVLIKDGKSTITTKNNAPDVSVTSPAMDNKFAALTAIQISVKASDADGKVTKVDFYNGKTFLYSTNKSPYTYTWKNVPAGNYTLTAKATDNDNAVTTSAGIKVSVYNLTANKAPTVSITSPEVNQNYEGPAAINISAKAADKDGKISKVEFYNGAKLLHTVYQSAYTYTWKDVPPGNYVLTAKATDNDGLSATSDKVKVTVVKNANKPPTVNITDPINKSNFTGPADIQLTANAKDADGKISRVEFYNGSTLLRIEHYYPYNYYWKKVPVGTYTLTAKAIDDKGLSTTSAEVRVTVKAKAQNRQAENSLNNMSQESIALNSNDSLKAINKVNAPGELVTMKLSPNPVRDVLNISTKGFQQNEPLTISVLSISGVSYKTIHSSASNQVVQVDVSSLPNGTYIVRIICEKKVLNKQFVKL